MPDNQDNQGNMALPGNNTRSRQDLKIAKFIPDTDPNEAAHKWERWVKSIAKKLRFFWVITLEDKMDALYIYGGNEVEQLLETLPDPAEEGVDVSVYIIKVGEDLNDFHKAIHKVQGLAH